VKTPDAPVFIGQIPSIGARTCFVNRKPDAAIDNRILAPISAASLMLLAVFPFRYFRLFYPTSNSCDPLFRFANL
jgi:hypothetical protein